jgi:hypothetical protein
MRRREFLSAVSAGIASAALAPGMRGEQEITPRKPKAVVKLFTSPEGFPNGLENTPEGLWIAEEISERAYLVDWKGKVLHMVQTESHNTSGIGVGGGYIWMGCNGMGVGRDRRPTDRPGGEVLQCDMKTGKTLKRYTPQYPGGIHGVTWNDRTKTLWVAALGINALVEIDPKDDFRILHEIPVRLGRAHGFDFEGDAIWCLFSNDLLIQKLDMKTGKVLDAIQLSNTDPDPHGLCMHGGILYYSDAGIAPGGKPSGTDSAGYICRIDM